MKISHTTIKEELGNCLICGKPILMMWKDKKEKNGHSEWYNKTKEGTIHYACIGGKSLHQINDERKLQRKI